MLASRIWFASLPGGLRTLLLLYGATGILMILVAFRIPAVEGVVSRTLVLTDSWWRQPWQVLTYTLVPSDGFGGAVRLAMGLMLLNWFGRPIEEMRGSAMLGSIWMLTSIGGGILGMVAAQFIGGSAVAVSLWAPLMGLMAAQWIWMPDGRIPFMLAGSIPVRYVLWSLVAITLLARPAGLASALVSVGGALFGILAARADQRGLDLARGLRGTGAWLDRQESRLADRCTDETPVQPPDEAQLNRVLDKINAGGMESLNDEDKRILDEASRA